MLRPYRIGANDVIQAARWMVRVGVAVLLAAVVALLAALAVRALTMAGHATPLDYGEGPLLAQLRWLLVHPWPWSMYRDPAQAPGIVANYPPLYHLLVLPFAWLTGDPLRAGRLVSLLAALGCVAAIGSLGRDLTPQPPLRHGEGVQTPRLPGGRTRGGGRTQHAASLRAYGVAALFLALPLVREWGTLLRVDLLGVALGLWGLCALRAGNLRRCGVLLVACLFVKPSLVAAPAAALLWLVLRDRGAALRLGTGMLVGGLGLVAALQLASGGWFWLHVVQANANVWRWDLAQGFWREQWAIHAPLWAAALLAAALAWRDDRAGTSLALLYTLVGAIAAFGVGKVGAYANYFLEMQAGLVWLVALGLRVWGGVGAGGAVVAGGGAVVAGGGGGRSMLCPYLVYGRAAIALLALGGLLRFYPLWSPAHAKPYGMIEGVRAPQWTFARDGVLADLRRERALLRVFARGDALLAAEVRGAGGPILTDTPGVAALGDAPAPLQAFEHRQLYEQQLYDQRPLLRDLANGQIPLAVFDYLGNWLTPELIQIVSHRYAQTGSRGGYDLYAPVAIGPRVALSTSRAETELRAYYLAGGAERVFAAGEKLIVTLEFGGAASARGNPPVILRLLSGSGQPVAESTLPLVYGALLREDWGGQALQHLQTLDLPRDLPEGDYQIIVSIAETTLEITRIRVAPGGAVVGDQFVPPVMLAAWQTLGGVSPGGPGTPLIPAVPFADGTRQCFMRACLLQQPDGTVIREPIGRVLAAGDLAAPTAAESLTVAADVGAQVTPALRSGERIVQYYDYARLARPVAGGPATVDAIGAEYLRLFGRPYRWR